MSFSQNWNACTKVIERMPPAATTTATMTATATDPAHGGQAGRDAHRERRALQLRHDVEPADDDDEQCW